MNAHGSALASELRKLLGLPSARVGIGLGLLLPVAVVLLNAGYVRKGLAAGTLARVDDLGYADLTIGVIGPLVLGVVAVSSEFTSGGEHAPDARQLVTSLVAVPRRLPFVLAKAGAVAVTVGAVALASAVATLTTTRLVLGDAVPPVPPVPPVAADRIAGAVLYWVLTALLASGITLCVRNGVVPLTVAILNTSVVSVSFLLSRLGDAAVLLPDLAGARMFVRDMDLPVLLPPVAGGLVMAAWTAGVLGLGALRLLRRDA